MHGGGRRPAPSSPARMPPGAERNHRVVDGAPDVAAATNEIPFGRGQGWQTTPPTKTVVGGWSQAGGGGAAPDKATIPAAVAPSASSPPGLIPLERSSSLRSSLLSADGDARRRGSSVAGKGAFPSVAASTGIREAGGGLAFECSRGSSTLDGRERVEGTDDVRVPSVQSGASKGEQANVRVREEGVRDVANPSSTVAATGMQQADYFRPYNLYHSSSSSATTTSSASPTSATASESATAVAAAAAAAANAAAVAAQHQAATYHSLYHPAAMPSVSTGRSSGSSLITGDPTGGASAADPMASFAFGSAGPAFRYDSSGFGVPHHPGGLYAGYGGSFDYSTFGATMSSTTHIPLDPYQQPATSSSTSSANFPTRPQPTRPSTDASRTGFSAPSEGPSPYQSGSLRSHNATTSPSSAMATSPASVTSPTAKDNANNNGKRNNSGNNNCSPEQMAVGSSPTNACEPNSPSSMDNKLVGDDKFRYPSGPSNNSVQSSASAPSPMQTGNTTAPSSTTGTSVMVGEMRGGGAVTPSSAMSSREGTPIGAKPEEPAPNVDISRVTIKDFMPPPPMGCEFSPPAPPSAAMVSGPPSAFSQHANPYLGAAAARLAYPGFDASGLSLHSATASPVSSLGARHQSGGTASSTSSASSGSHHAHVKIGRRPSHLPKVLKFTDKSLPPGWIRKLKQRKHGKQQGRWDVYIYSPCGVKFASRKKLKAFFEKNNLRYDPEDFDFTPYGRHIDQRTSAGSSGLAGSTSAAGSRHNSSGSTGSDGTHPGSSPASIANYSPTHGTGYLGHHSHVQHMHSSSVSMMGPAGAGTVVTCSAPTTYDYLGSASSTTSFAQFDPHMESPPNVSTLDVPPASTASSISSPSTSTSTDPLALPSLYGATGTLPYLGRSHHHSIFSGREPLGAGSEFFPSADMADLLGSSAEVAATSTSSNGAYPAIPAVPEVVEESSDSKAGIVKAEPTTLASEASTNESSPSVEGNGVSSGGGDTPSGHGSNGERGGFNLGRTMSVLNANQEGFEDFYTY